MHLRDAFENPITAPTLAKRLLAIHGVGGVGKSALLKMFRLHCDRVNVPVALASGDDTKSTVDYASLLSTWALMNSSDDRSNHGYRKPGLLDDGAMSWGFQPRRVGTEWNPATRDLPRGAWPVCGEADHGLTAGIESARTVVFDDPLFGLLAYGGEAVQAGGTINVIRRDGVRQRFSARLGDRRLHLELDRDGFAEGKPVELSPKFDFLRFTVENRGVADHVCVFRTEGIPPGTYGLLVNGKRQPAALISTGLPLFVTFPISTAGCTAVTIQSMH